MRIHCIRHESFEGLAYIEKWISGQQHSLKYTHTYLNQAFPIDMDFELLIIMGGTDSVYEADEKAWLLKEKRFIAKALGMGKNILGICFGAQIIADVLGAKVYPASQKEIGWFPVCFNPDLCNSINFLPDEIIAFHWHSDTFDIPSGAIHLASSGCTPNQGFIIEKNVVALQFHLEMNKKGVDQLLSAMGHTLIPAQYVQSDYAIRQRTDLFRDNNRLMEFFLNYVSST